jgi:HipA-like protein
VIDFDHKITDLDVNVAGRAGGQLRRRSQFEFEYLPAAAGPVSLLMPVEDRTFRDSELFAVMDMNLPEGFLLAQLRERSPKRPPTKMQLLALMGENGIGRLGYREPDRPRTKAAVAGGLRPEGKDLPRVGECVSLDRVRALRGAAEGPGSRSREHSDPERAGEGGWS